MGWYFFHRLGSLDIYIVLFSLPLHLAPLLTSLISSVCCIPFSISNPEKVTAEVRQSNGCSSSFLIEARTDKKPYLLIEDEAKASNSSRTHSRTWYGLAAKVKN